jgi:hypothetical protein
MAEFSLRRTTTINAPATAIYPLIADLRQWQSWSPWEGLDPDLERTYSGADAGVGAVYEWSGNRKAGSGRMEITEATEPPSEPTKVVIDLQFLKPFKAHNTTTFELVQSGDVTRVNWIMRGPQNILMRVMGVVFRMEKTVGKDFDKGLAALKAEAEGATA